MTDHARERLEACREWLRERSLSPARAEDLAAMVKFCERKAALAALGSVEWHLRSLELAATGGLDRVPAITVRYHVRQIRAALESKK